MHDQSSIDNRCVFNFLSLLWIFIGHSVDTLSFWSENLRKSIIDWAIARFLYRLPLLFKMLRIFPVKECRMLWFKRHCFYQSIHRLSNIRMVILQEEQIASLPFSLSTLFAIRGFQLSSAHRDYIDEALLEYHILASYSFDQVSRTKYC